MYSPLVTIITPTYKHEVYIRECIESVIKQSYSNWEMLIVDDCSPDRTFEIAQDYARKDSRIKAIQKSVRGGPEGLGVSYNTALGLAKGELIAILEGDDYWPEDKLTIQVPFHENKEVCLSWGWCCIRRGDEVESLKQGKASIQKYVYPSLQELLEKNMIPPLTVLIRKEKLLEIGGFWQPDGALLVDYPTWLRLSTVGKNLYIPECLGFYRIHASQVTKQNAEKILVSGLNFVAEFLDQLTLQQRKMLNMRSVDAGLNFRRAQLYMARREKLVALRYLSSAIVWGSFRIKCLALRLLFGEGVRK